MRILILGAGGQVGSALKSHMAAHGEVIAYERSDVDFAVTGMASAAVDHVRPNLVINAAAYTAVDKAETERETANEVNAISVGEVARACVRHGAALIHYSTDYVFNGTKRGPYTVRDRPAPVGAYGMSKYAGERAVIRMCVDGDFDSPARNWTERTPWLVLRVAWVYAPQGRNFLLTMLRLAREGKSLHVVSDQHGTPMSADWIARMTAELVRPDATLSATGIQHMSPAGSTTWHGFAQRIMERAHAHGLLPGIAEPPRVNAIRTADFPTPARRPAQSRLADSLGDLLPPRPDWTELLEETLSQMAAGAGQAAQG
jgi:dTDP-4-dehydrorhamnose reductase